MPSYKHYTQTASLRYVSAHVASDDFVE